MKREERPTHRIEQAERLQRIYLLRLVRSAMLILGAAFTVVTALLWLFGLALPIGFLVGLEILFFGALGYVFERRGWYEGASGLVTAGFFCGALLGELYLGIGHSPLLSYALAVLLAGVLLGLRQAIVTAVWATLAYYGVGLLEQRGMVYQPTGPLEILLSNTFAVGVAMIAIAIVSWISTRRVYQWLAEAYEESSRRAQELEQSLAEREEILHKLQALSLRQEQLLETVHSVAAPVIPLGLGVILVPLTGYFDADRAQRIRPSVLEGFARHRARTLIVDLTGVVDLTPELTASLRSTIRAVQLMGGQVILTGVRAEVAWQLAEARSQLGELQIRQTLQEGLALAYRRSFPAMMEVAR